MVAVVSHYVLRYSPVAARSHALTGWPRSTAAPTASSRTALTATHPGLPASTIPGLPTVGTPSARSLPIRDTAPTLAVVAVTVTGPSGSSAALAGAAGALAPAARGACPLSGGAALPLGAWSYRLHSGPYPSFTTDSAKQPGLWLADHDQLGIALGYSQLVKRRLLRLVHRLPRHLDPLHPSACLSRSF